MIHWLNLNAPFFCYCLASYCFYRAGRAASYKEKKP